MTDDQYALQLSADLLEKYVAGSLTGVASNAKLKTSRALELAGIQEITTFEKFESAYRANEISADSRFGNNRLILRGTVQEIRKDAFNNPVVNIRGNNQFMPVIASLTASAGRAAVDWSKGQTVALVCKSGGLHMALVSATDCDEIDTYLEARRSDWLDVTKAFLSGSVELPKDAGQGLIDLYAAAPLFRNETKCERLTDGCQKIIRQSIAKLNGNKSKNSAVLDTELADTARHLNERRDLAIRLARFEKN